MNATLAERRDRWRVRERALIARDFLGIAGLAPTAAALVAGIVSGTPMSLRAALFLALTCSMALGVPALLLRAKAVCGSCGGRDLGGLSDADLDEYLSLSPHKRLAVDWVPLEDDFGTGDAGSRS